MDLIRETSDYATQLDQNSLKNQAELQLSFANIWLNFVRKKKSINNTLKDSNALPMWLVPGVRFLQHICSLQFTSKIDDTLFDKFNEKMQNTFHYLYNSNENNRGKLSTRNSLLSRKPLKLSPNSPATRTGYGANRKKKGHFSRIEQLEFMDKSIDRRRLKEGLIGKIRHDDQIPNSNANNIEENG